MVDKLVFGLSELAPLFYAHQQIDQAAQQQLEPNESFTGAMLSGGLLRVARNYFAQPPIQSDIKVNKKDGNEVINAPLPNSQSRIGGQDNPPLQEPVSKQRPGYSKRPDSEIQQMPEESKEEVESPREVSDLDALLKKPPKAKVITEEQEAEFEEGRFKDALKMEQWWSEEEDRVRGYLGSLFDNFGAIDAYLLSGALKSLWNNDGFKHSPKKPTKDNEGTTLLPPNIKRLPPEKKQELDQYKAELDEQEPLRPSCRRFVYFNDDGELDSYVLCQDGYMQLPGRGGSGSLNA